MDNINWIFVIWKKKETNSQTDARIIAKFELFDSKNEVPLLYKLRTKRLAVF